jgi:SsrA-binding protein
MPVEIINRKASYEFYIDARYQAGLVLQGTEIKSIREGKVNFGDSFCVFHQTELFVRSLHIAEYAMGTYTNHDPMRERKLLLSKRELRKLEAKTKEKGFAIIPLRIFFSEKGLAKMEIGLCRGKKMFDKRESIKERESTRAIKRQYGV